MKFENPRKMLLKITPIPPRNLFLRFKLLYVFPWRYDNHDIIYACRYSNKKFAKKFWATFVAQLLRNRCICENGHSIFVIFRTPVNTVNFQCDKSVLDTSYLISKDFNIICVSKKNIVDVTPCWCNIHQHKKKLAQIFEDFFAIFMISVVPVVLQQALKYCCQMLLMMQTTEFDNINMLQKLCAIFYLC